MKSLLALLSLIIMTSSVSYAQDAQNQEVTPSTFGKGLIHKYAADSSWYAKVTMRIQTRYEGYHMENVGEGEQSYVDRFRVRRARIKGGGWATKSRRLKYKFEYDVHNGFVLDAVVKWVFDKNRNWELWFGQTKLPGNIERVISSQAMVFVDRSLLNSRFTLDRDAGIQLRGKQKLSSGFTIKEKFAFSQGEGLNQTQRSSGHGYTARLELYPFGDFKDAYTGSAFKRYESPRLLIAATYDLNRDALRSRGQGGGYLDERLTPSDLSSIYVDTHFKYGGFSLMGEYAWRTSSGDSPTITTQDIGDDGLPTTIIGTYYTGSAFNLQAAYLLSSNWEVAGRLTHVEPEMEVALPQDQFGLAISRYIVGHNLKVQTDVNVLQIDGSNEEVMFRLQTEFTF